MDPQVTGPEASQAELRRGFDAFIEAAQRLEQSYAALKVRADAMDLQLAEANRALDRTLTEREAIFAALPMGLMAFAGDGELTWCNTEAKRLRELTELAGVNVAEAPEGDTSTNGLTVRVQRIDLEDRGKLVLVEDRSRLAHLEGEVDRLDRLAGLSELALGIAHEIKNPLNGVMGFASLMERSSDPDDSRRYAAKIHQGLNQVDSIVKALLAFARPEGKAGPVASVETIVGEAAICAGVPRSRVMTTGDLQERAESGALVRVLDNLFRNSREAAGEEVRYLRKMNSYVIFDVIRFDSGKLDWLRYNLKKLKSHFKVRYLYVFRLNRGCYEKLFLKKTVILFCFIFSHVGVIYLWNHFSETSACALRNLSISI